MEKQLKLLMGTLVFVLLFYHQDIGLNLCFFALLLWGLLYFKSSPRRRDRTFRLLSAALFISTVAFAWYGDFFSFSALVLAAFCIGLYSQYPKINTVLYPGLLLANFVTFIFRVFCFKYWIPKNSDRNIWWKKVLAFFLIPTLLFLAFVGIYAAQSETFYRFFTQFTFLPDVGQVFILALIGFFFVFNYWFFFLPRIAIKLNAGLGDRFAAAVQEEHKPTFHFLDVDLERKSGEISLIVLNLLLLFFILTYNYEQFFQQGPNENLSHAVHQQVISLIFSIFMAIAVILFYFKSTFNFDCKAGLLKHLAISWMVLNAGLVLSAFIKNAEYVLYYGLTFRRIGVFIFLALSLTGLCFTYIKIKHKRTNSYLFRQMIRIVFATFIICSTLNFSWIVTRYNIAFHKNEDPDYLRDLPYNKQLLYNTYKRNPAWQPYFEKQRAYIQKRTQRPFLSFTLYYTFLDL